VFFAGGAQSRQGAAGSTGSVGVVDTVEEEASPGQLRKGGL